MRILYYTPHPSLNLAAATGYGSHMRGMIGAFRALGHEVLPVIRGGTELSPVIMQKGGWKGAVKKVVPGVLWRTMKDIELRRFDRQSRQILQEQIAVFKPDLIYERGAYLLSSGVTVAGEFAIPYYLEVNAPYAEEARALEGAASLLEKEALKAEALTVKGAKKVMVVSSALKRHLTDKYQLSGDKIIITPNCINPEEIKTDENIKHAVIDRYQLAGHTVIGFVGSVFPYHGVDMLIRAFDRVWQKNKSVKLLIVGDGLLEEQKKIASGLPSAAHIIFTGPVSHQQVFSYIDCMDITVMAKSNWYGSPVKIFEYGAMGKAIIAPDTVPVKDVMVDGKDGLLVTPMEEKLGNAIMRLVSDEHLRRQVANEFQKKVLGRYIWEKTAMQVLTE